MRILTVWEITGYIKDLLQSDPILSDVWVRGEISNFTRSAAGHIYFTLKAENTQLKSVLFRGNARLLSFVPKNGDAVIAHGNISVYEASGQYQLYVDLVQPEGTGLLQLQFEELRQRLEREGLFEPSRKRPLPAYPRCIGVVTSSSGAVWHDIQTVFSRRYPLCELLLAPSLVQGDTAPDALVRALEALQEDGRPDFIVVARGGGSMEDLWCFNDERVARAVFACSIPVVSAIGHETDYTICDFVADLRAPTPSAAAEMIAPHIREMQQTVNELGGQLQALMLDRLRGERHALEVRAGRVERRSPSALIRHERVHLDAKASLMLDRLSGRINAERARLVASTRELSLLHPQQIMERGYAIVLDPVSGSRVHSAAGLSRDQELVLRFHDGLADVRVESAQIDRTLQPANPAAERE
jgi:exodeoxyribonuclease VII large subunit